MKDYDKSKPALILAPHWAQSKTPDTAKQGETQHTQTVKHNRQMSGQTGATGLGASTYLTIVLSAVEQH